MYLCDASCIPVCDFCHYFVDPPKDDNGVYKTENGWCKRHKRKTVIYGECQQFHCMRLDPPSGLRINTIPYSEEV